MCFKISIDTYVFISYKTNENLNWKTIKTMHNVLDGKRQQQAGSRRPLCFQHYDENVVI